MFFFLVYTISVLDSENVEISSRISFIKFGKSARRSSSYNSLSKESLSELELSKVITNFSSKEAEEDNLLELEDWLGYGIRGLG